MSRLFKKISNCRSEETGDSTEDTMDFLKKMPQLVFQSCHQDAVLAGPPRLGATGYHCQ